MPEVILNCPQCQRQLRVTEELQGRPVKCPACGLTFTVPAGSAEAKPLADIPDATEVPVSGQRPRYEGIQPGEEYYDEPRTRREYPEGWDPQRARERAKSLVLPPAICLIVAATLGLLGDLYQVAAWSAAPDAQIQQVEEVYKAFNFQAPPGLQQFPGFMIAAHAAFAVLCLVIVVCSIQMMRLRWYPMALIGSLLPIINCGSNCCCLGLPLGIWAFIILMKSEVRAAFYSQGPV